MEWERALLWCLQAWLTSHPPCVLGSGCRLSCLLVCKVVGTTVGRCAEGLVPVPAAVWLRVRCCQLPLLGPLGAWYGWEMWQKLWWVVGVGAEEDQ